jgi:hypothetical protein
VEGVAEWRDKVGVAAGRQYAADFGHHARGVVHMLEDGVAFYALEEGITEGQTFGVGGDIDAGHTGEIEIDVAGDSATRSADIQIPAAEREVSRLAWIHHKGRGRLDSATQAGA